LTVLGPLGKAGTLGSAAVTAYDAYNAPTAEQSQLIVIGYTVDLATGYLVATVIVIAAPESAPAYMEIAATATAASAEMGIGQSAAPTIESAIQSSAQHNTPTYTPVVCNNPIMCLP
jgi:hypothetical protein